MLLVLLMSNLKHNKLRLSFSRSLNLSKDFNDIIENKTGIASDKTYARVKAQVCWS